MWTDICLQGEHCLGGGGVILWSVQVLIRERGVTYPQQSIENHEKKPSHQINQSRFGSSREAFEALLVEEEHARANAPPVSLPPN